MPVFRRRSFTPPPVIFSLPIFVAQTMAASFEGLRAARQIGCYTVAMMRRNDRGDGEEAALRRTLHGKDARQGGKR